MLVNHLLVSIFSARCLFFCMIVLTFKNRLLKKIIINSMRVLKENNLEKILKRPKSIDKKNEKF